jgi:signal transduction histidine kinase
VLEPRRSSARTTVQGDGDRLRSALDALIENAVDHTKVGGRIELSVRREANMVALAVSDSGPGISGEDLERIFDRFARIELGPSVSFYVLAR